MTIKDLISSINFDSNIKNIDYGQKNYSKDKHDAFSNVFESANKSYNFSFEKKEKFSYKNLNQASENKEFKAKEFKSDYENFYSNKLDNKKTDNPIKKDYSDKKENYEKIAKDEAVDKTANPENKPEIKEKEITNKQEDKNISKDNKNLNSDKQVVSEVKEETLTEQPDNAVANGTEVKSADLEVINSLLQNELQSASLNEDVLIQTVLVNPEVTASENSEVIPLQANASQEDLQGETSPVQKQATGEQTMNKPAENTLQQPIKKNSSENLTQVNPEELKKPDKQNQDAAAKQEQSKKPEILASNAVLNNLNAIDKNPVALAHSEKLASVSEKLAEILNNEDAKPVITNVEVKNIAPKAESGAQQDKQQPQQDLKQNINPIQALSSDETNLQKIELSKTSQFDKILNSKQAANTENSVLNQLKDKISSEITANKSQITIALKPYNLGRVDINIVSKDGTLTAQITAENNQVKDILTKNLETLRQNMSEQGINVGKMVVNVQEPQTSNNNLNSENTSRSFEQANSNASNMDNQPNKQNLSNESTSAYSDNQSYEFDEEIENEAGESNSPNIRVGQVDYKV